MSFSSIHDIPYHCPKCGSTKDFATLLSLQSHLVMEHAYQYGGLFQNGRHYNTGNADLLKHQLEAYGAIEPELVHAHVNSRIRGIEGLVKGSKMAVPDNPFSKLTKSDVFIMQPWKTPTFNFSPFSSALHQHKEPLQGRMTHQLSSGTKSYLPRLPLRDEFATTFPYEDILGKESDVPTVEDLRNRDTLKQLQNDLQNKNVQLGELQKQLDSLKNSQKVFQNNETENKLLELKLKDLQLQKARSELERAAMDAQKLRRENVDTAKENEVYRQHIGILNEAVVKKEEEMTQKEAELQNLSSYLDEVADKETEAREKLETFISDLIDKADKSQKNAKALKKENKKLEATLNKTLELSQLVSPSKEDSRRSLESNGSSSPEIGTLRNKTMPKKSSNIRKIASPVKMEKTPKPIRRQHRLSDSGVGDSVDTEKILSLRSSPRNYPPSHDELNVDEDGILWDQDDLGKPLPGGFTPTEPPDSGIGAGKHVADKRNSHKNHDKKPAGTCLETSVSHVSRYNSPLKTGDGKGQDSSKSRQRIKNVLKHEPDEESPVTTSHRNHQDVSNGKATYTNLKEIDKNQENHNQRSSSKDGSMIKDKSNKSSKTKNTTDEHTRKTKGRKKKLPVVPTENRDTMSDLAVEQFPDGDICVATMLENSRATDSQTLRKRNSAEMPKRIQPTKAEESLLVEDNSKMPSLTGKSIEQFKSSDIPKNRYCYSDNHKDKEKVQTRIPLVEQMELDALSMDTDTSVYSNGDTFAAKHMHEKVEQQLSVGKDGTNYKYYDDINLYSDDQNWDNSYRNTSFEREIEEAQSKPNKGKPPKSPHQPQIKRPPPKPPRRFSGDLSRMSDALFCIFMYLDTRHLTKMAAVCKLWRLVSRHPALWRRVSLKHGMMSSKYLVTISSWCTQMESLQLEDLLPRHRYTSETTEDYDREITGSLETGLDCLLRASQDTVVSIAIEDCGCLVTERCLWLVSSYCRNLQSLTYVSDHDTVGPEALWALGAGCDGLKQLDIHPLLPNDMPDKFTKQCVRLIGQCWPGLLYLSLGGACVSHTELCTIAKCCPDLIELQIFNSPKISTETVNSIATSGGHLKNLHTLKIVFTPVEPQALVMLKDLCPGLKSLHVQIRMKDYYTDINNKRNVNAFNGLEEQLKIMKRKDLAGILSYKIR